MVAADSVDSDSAVDDQHKHYCIADNTVVVEEWRHWDLVVAASVVLPVDYLVVVAGVVGGAAAAAEQLAELDQAAYQEYHHHWPN